VGYNKMNIFFKAGGVVKKQLKYSRDLNTRIILLWDTNGSLFELGGLSIKPWVRNHLASIYLSCIKKMTDPYLTPKSWFTNKW
jgi:hypothetical protein